VKIIGLNEMDDMKKNVQLAIILVNWNSTVDTLNCIESIYKSTLEDYIIIVVDNGSNKSQLQKIVDCGFNINLIKAGENLGYTGGNNLGIDYALKKKVEYVLLLNNDTFIAKNTLENMIRSADSDKQIGVLSPKIFFYPEKHLIWSAGPTFNNLNLMGNLTGYKELDKECYNREGDVDYVSGCAMLIRTKVIKEIGKLREDYFATCEDIDFCLKIRSHGYRIFYEPSASVWHIESASSGGSDAPQYAYYQTRNYLVFHSRWAQNFWQLVISQLYYLAFLIKRSFLFLINKNFKGVLAIFLGIKDAVLGNMGRQEYRILKKSVSKK